MAWAIVYNPAMHPLVFLEGDGSGGGNVEDAMPIPGVPGAIGVTGSQGPVGPVVWLEADQGEDGMSIPGNPGLPGPTGASGTLGLTVILEADQGEDGMPIPGSRGIPGPTGPQGPSGAPVWLEADQGEDGMVIPGPAGAAGAAGSTTSLLGSNYVLGEQTTTSTSYVDLATADSVSFTLSGVHDVLILYLAFWGQDTINGIDYNEVFLDGTGQANSEHFNGIPVTRDIATICNYRLSSVSSGSHTVSIRHKVSAGTTGFWKNRMLTCWLAS